MCRALLARSRASRSDQHVRLETQQPGPGRVNGCAHRSGPGGATSSRTSSVLDEDAPASPAQQSAAHPGQQESRRSRPLVEDRRRGWSSFLGEVVAGPPAPACARSWTPPGSSLPHQPAPGPRARLLQPDRLRMGRRICSARRARRLRRRSLRPDCSNNSAASPRPPSVGAWASSACSCCSRRSAPRSRLVAPEVYAIVPHRGGDARLRWRPAMRLRGLAG